MTANTKYKQFPFSCQEEKNLIKTLNQLPGYDVVLDGIDLFDVDDEFSPFMREAIFKYCKSISENKNSPWHYNQNPVSLSYIHGVSNLSQNQIRIIQFLHKDYFRNGKPCYLKINNFIKQIELSVNKRSMRRSLATLSDKGLIHRILFTHSGKYVDRMCLIPSNKFVKKSQLG